MWFIFIFFFDVLSEIDLVMDVLSVKDLFECVCYLRGRWKFEMLMCWIVVLDFLIRFDGLFCRLGMLVL